jgi:hypothetical protein
MRDSVHSFIEFWSQFSGDAKPFVHPEDAAFVRQGDFELGLLPLPVNGSLAGAEVVILTLNPGLDPEDYEWENTDVFRASIVRNLTQEHGPLDYPFFYLDPRFDQHPGAGYWSCRRTPKRPKREQQKLRAVIEAVAERDGVSVESAQAHVARKVAVLQLCPYHSANMGRRDLLRKLPSSLQARKLVKALVASGDKLVVAMRSVSEWGFTGPVDSENLVVYPSSLGISASLSPSSAGGAAMLRRLSSAG